MIARRPLLIATGLAATGAFAALRSSPAEAATGAEIDRAATAAYRTLLEQSPAARTASERARAVLIFPNILEGGFVVGGQYGEGVLRRGGANHGYFSIAAASFGLQIGAQSYSQVLFFMTDAAVGYLDRSAGFEIGADASATAFEAGIGADLDSTTLTQPIVAFAFGERGLLAGLTLKGSKITPIQR